MNRTALIGIIVAAIVIVVLGFWLFTRVHQTPTENQQPGNQFPTSTSTTSISTTTQTMTVATTDGSSVSTRDFKDDPGVIAHPYNTTDYYILVGTDDPMASNPPYEIDYSDKDQSFGITLYQEPLGTYREQAEQDLMQRLGISESDMCRLNYIVATGPGVSDIYNGDNLLFSFCPGATPLPD